MKQHTPGPWAWYERHDGQVYLATPNRGHLVVMDFVRLGMNYAQPRFAEWDGDERANMGGIMRPAKELILPSHPDVRLIENAPMLLAACKAAMEDCQCAQRCDGPHKDCPCWYCRCGSVIAKCEGIS